MSRQEVSLRPPPDDPTALHGLPTVPVDRLERCTRAVHSSCWFFSESGDGRFDLSCGTHGTCYLASDFIGAMLEVLGPGFEPGDTVSVSEFSDRRVYVCTARDTTAVADLNDNRWRSHGVTREIHTITPYQLPQAWAQRIHQAEYEGLSSQARHDLRLEHYTVALFGLAGPRINDPRMADDGGSIIGIDQIEHFSSATGIRVAATPTTRQSFDILR